jgi:hypothetical protein
MWKLKKLKKRLRRVRLHKDVTKVLLHHDNARPYTSAYSRGHHKASVDCPASSTLLASCDYQFFSPLKDAICGKKFVDDEEVISEVKRWLRKRPAE